MEKIIRKASVGREIGESERQISSSKGQQKKYFENLVILHESRQESRMFENKDYT